MHWLFPAQLTDRVVVDISKRSELLITMALNQVGKVSAKAARAVRDGYAASMASIVSVFLLMCESRVVCKFTVVNIVVKSLTSHHYFKQLQLT